MPIYIGTKKVKNIWMDITKIKNIYIGTNKVYSSNIASVGDSITISASCTVYEGTQTAALSLLSVVGNTLTISNGKIYNNGTSAVTLSVSGNTRATSSPGSGGGMLWTYLNYTGVNGTAQSINLGYGINNSSLNANVSSKLITIAPNSYISFSVLREYDSYYQTITFNNYTLSVTAVA